MDSDYQNLVNGFCKREIFVPTIIDLIASFYYNVQQVSVNFEWNHGETGWIKYKIEMKNLSYKLIMEFQDLQCTLYLHKNKFNVRVCNDQKVIWETVGLEKFKQYENMNLMVFVAVDNDKQDPWFEVVFIGEKEGDNNNKEKASREIKFPLNGYSFSEGFNVSFQAFGEAVLTNKGVSGSCIIRTS